MKWGSPTIVIEFKNCRNKLTWLDTCQRTEAESNIQIKTLLRVFFQSCCACCSHSRAANISSTSHFHTGANEAPKMGGQLEGQASQNPPHNGKTCSTGNCPEFCGHNDVMQHHAHIVEYSKCCSQHCDSHLMVAAQNQR